MPTRTALALLCLATAGVAQSTVDPLGRSILFIRGADASGGATHGGTPAQRTEQLSDIFNNGTQNGNHGYGTLRTTLITDGFTVAQLIESSSPLTLVTLLQHRVVVFGSNNKIYAAAEVRDVHTFIDRGGSALFISDANWGLTWEAAPASDNQFLGRYGARVYQDSGHLPTMARATSGRYLVSDHPVLSGPDGIGSMSDVNSYNGEGVNLFRITMGSAGYQAIRMVSADGLNVRLNTTNGNAGGTRAAGPGDAAMIFAEKGQSRIVGHFDRNTFFNLNGAGTDIHKLNNRQLALNLFRYLASVPARSVPLGLGCGRAGSPTLAIGAPILGRTVRFDAGGATANRPSWLVFSGGGPKPVGFPNRCTTYVDLANTFVLFITSTDATGGWTQNLALPESHALSGLRETMQVLTLVANGPFLAGGELSNGVELLIGYPR